MVDDDPAFQETVARYLEGYRRLSAFNASQAQAALRAHHVDVMVLDLELPGQTGLELLNDLGETREDLEIIILTGHATLETAHAAGRDGAFDYLAKSLDTCASIGVHIERALRHRRQRRAELARSAASDRRQLFRELRKARSPAFTELLRGGPGVGKRLLAELAHAGSPRASGPFVPVDAERIHEAAAVALFGEDAASAAAPGFHLGRCELADGGTLFVAHIDRLPAEVQDELARVVISGEVRRPGASEAAPVDLRLMASQVIGAAASPGAITPALAAVLAADPLEVPALGARLEDLPALIAGLLGRLPAPRIVLSDAALAALRLYPWPGNVAELEQLLARLSAHRVADTVEIEDLPIEVCLEYLARLPGPTGPAEQALYARARRQLEWSYLRSIAGRFAATHGLTRRESQTLTLFVEGCSHDEVCRRLAVEKTTLKTWIRSILQRSGATRIEDVVRRVHAMTGAPDSPP